MFGLIGRITAQPGKRGELAAILMQAGGHMPGCLTYIVANDPAHPEALYVTETWESREAHAASLQLPGVKAAIAKGHPLIADFQTIAETQPLGGVGLGSSYDNP